MVVFMALFVATSLLHGAERVHHVLEVRLHPETQRFSAQDTMTIPSGMEPAFTLHKGLNPTSLTPGVKIQKDTVKQFSVPVESFTIDRPAGLETLVIQYEGKIHHPLELFGKEHARGFKQTPGLISKQGVYLGANSYWYPTFNRSLVTFSVQIASPPQWDAVSQGRRTRHERNEQGTVVQWESEKPHEEIHIIAAPFVEYTRKAGNVLAMVFLRTPDEGLANKYLDVTAQYLAMYEDLIGPYPYQKFALVENFWETGYGMASFTLLGSKIIRFPFILHSSYPHEILHNWWGNSVFPDYAKGNWSEGLTAYLADHLIKEMRGNGAEHRQQTLQKYADYVMEERDFPLTEFRSRHSSSSEAVGYGKSLMVFHMLRHMLGDDTFSKGLQAFYRKYQYQTASFDDLRKSFERVSGKNLAAFFDQWTTRSGAPQLQVSKTQARAKKSGYILTAFIEQVQPESHYELQVPVAVTMEGKEDAYQTIISMDKKRLPVQLAVPAKPLRIDIDPEFDVFRRLDRNETPPALTQALGARHMLIVLPASSPQTLLEAYEHLAQALSQSGPDKVDITFDNHIQQIPQDRSVVLVGWNNAFRHHVVAALSPYDVILQDEEIRIGPTTIPKQNHSVVLTARQPNNANASLTWVASSVPDALVGLGRKLPHYHKYSYLGFQGDEPENMAKGRWPVVDSPMTVFVSQPDGLVSSIERGKLAPRKSLAALPPVFSKDRMMETVRFLTSEKMEGRGFGSRGLERAGDFVASKFQEAGLKPAGDTKESFFQTWEDRGGETDQKTFVRNIVGVIPGQDETANNQTIVIGAHYDHLGLGWPEGRKEHLGQIHPGADDNASGIAVLLELAKVLGKTLKPDRSVVFVAFTGEEAGRRGSKYYISHQQADGAKQCIGMINLDTVGRLEKGKLLVLGGGSAKEWVHIFRGAGFVTGVNVQTISEELDASDHVSFQEAGIPAVQLFTGPHLDYHRPSDTPDKIDSQGLVKVASVAKEAIVYLASREAILTSTLTPGSSPEPTVHQGKRKVSLGTIPDFSFSGRGCRLSGVVPDSPAEKSGLQEGDVITRLGTFGVNNLRDLSDALKSLSPGDTISITFLRKGEEMSTEAAVTDR